MFHDKMTKKKLKTFSEIRKKAKEVVLKANRNLFGHMVLVAQSGELHMSNVLAHPLGPLPWALANGDVSPQDKQGSSHQKVGEECCPVRSHPRTINNHHQWNELGTKMKGNDKTFAQLAESTLAKVLHGGGKSECIDVDV